MRRVRHLAGVGGAANRALVTAVAHLGAADIALRNVIENKINFEIRCSQVPT
jgi:hypothetical protein